MRWVAFGSAVMVFGLMSSRAAFAHDDVVGTSPSNGDRLTAVAEEIRIEFSADDSPCSGTGSITGPTGQPLRQGEARGDKLGDPDGKGDSPC